MKKEYIPNLITILRIIGTVILLFLPLYSNYFFYLYIFCGFTDILDGFIARRFNLTSELGSRLDSIADLCFYFVMTVKIFKDLIQALPWYVWIVSGILIVIRLISYVITYVKTKHIQHTHSQMNKFTGLMVFILPFVLKTSYFKYYIVISLLIASLGTLDDFFKAIKSNN